MAKRHIVMTGLLLFVFVPAGFSQDSMDLSDSDKLWNVRLVPPPLEEGGGVFFGFLEVIKDSFSQLSTRTLLRAEAEGRQNMIWNEEIREEQRQYTSFIEERDDLIFSDENILERGKTGRELRKKLRQSRTRLEELRSLDPAFIALNVERELDVTILEDDRISVNNAEIAAYARENEVHQIFSFRLETIGDYQRVRIYEYNWYRDEHREIFQRSTQNDELSSLVDVFMLTLAHRILGYQVASLTIRAVDSDDRIVQTAKIYVDGKLSSLGEYAEIFQRIGPVEVEIETVEGELITKELTLLPEEQRTISILIVEPKISENIQLLSIPSDVGVYFESRWIGNTPMSVGQSGVQRYLQFIREGYFRSWVLLRPNSPDIITVQMVPDTRDLQEELNKKRDQFYTSIIMLAASIPFPIVFSALYQSQRYYLNAPLSADQKTGIQRSYQAYYGTFWGTLGVTLGFTGYMVYRLADYIIFADRMTLEAK